MLALPLAVQEQKQDPPIPADTTIQTTASGLQYSVLAAGGPGPRPKMGDKVRVHYTGWLPGGKMFDSSRERGEPAEFVLGQVIQGWNEGLQLMAPGARFKFTIPYALGYGERGFPPDIPGKSTLIFDVELLAVIAMPQFRPARPDAQKSCASGLKYEALVAGEGGTPGPEDVYEFEYALFNTSGKLLDCSEMRDGATKARLSDLQIPFFREALPLMQAGAHYRFEVPPSLAFGERPMSPDLPGGSVTVWELKLKRLVKPLPVPAFRVSPPDKLQKTASGLQYEVLQPGTGATPARGAKVTVHYAGWLLDGTLFDSSYGRGEPSEFRLGEVIDGWNEGLALMQEGAVYQFTIPAQLAYGPEGSPPVIGPNQTLVFLVQLIQVQK
ncbi:MAG: FKBP-type peptidyl-prolyl cis-trans isomerase [Planctomycetota bacterium]|nr:MAG: FKBP-type peptidyl-prolyl cis-trans isomerase [Planctomycetota bacterium]